MSSRLICLLWNGQVLLFLQKGLVRQGISLHIQQPFDALEAEVSITKAAPAGALHDELADITRH